eukprot:23725-Eustigmatos_ZCMA.PRE.1
MWKKQSLSCQLGWNYGLTNRAALLKVFCWSCATTCKGPRQITRVGTIGSLLELKHPRAAATHAGPASVMDSAQLSFPDFTWRTVLSTALVVVVVVI